MKNLLLLLFLFSSFVSFSQDSNELDTLGKELLHPIPKKATFYSAILPGAGQVYNKKYWKVPILYAGFGLAGYFAIDYQKDVNTIRDLINSGRTDLLPTLNQRKSWRDRSYIALVLIYALNIIDANVDAHLAHFDVSDDLSLEILPYTDLTAHRSSGLTLVLKL